MKNYFFTTIVIIFALSNLKAQSISEKVRYDRWVPGSVNSNTLDSIQQTVDSFFATMGDSYIDNKYWLQSDFEKYVAPYRYLISANDYWSLPSPLVPYVMSVKPIEYYPGSYLLMIAYLGHVDTAYEMIYGIYYVIATKDSSDNIKLRHPEEYLTKDWRKETIGTIKYIVSPQKNFSEKEARQMDSFNRHIADYFKTDVITVNYFSCANQREFYLVQGEENFALTGDYLLQPGGGIGDGLAKSIYSANQTEYYPHELVHIYIEQFNNRRIKKSKLAYEGIPTYLGGSRGFGLDKHLHNVVQYATEKNIKSISELLEMPGSSEISNRETDIVYAIGGLIAKLVDAKAGYKGLIKLFNTPKDDVFKYVAGLYSISQEEFMTYLMAELMKNK